MSVPDPNVKWQIFICECGYRSVNTQGPHRPATVAVDQVVRYDSPSWGRCQGKILATDAKPNHVLVQDLHRDGAREYWPDAAIECEKRPEETWVRWADLSPELQADVCLTWAGDFDGIDLPKDTRRVLEARELVMQVDYTGCTDDERAGMEWFNALSRSERERWLMQSREGTPASAYAAWKAPVYRPMSDPTPTTVPAPDRVATPSGDPRRNLSDVLHKASMDLLHASFNRDGVMSKPDAARLLQVSGWLQMVQHRVTTSIDGFPPLEIAGVE